MATIKQRWDSFTNALTNLGGARDKRTFAHFERSAVLTDEELDNLYHNNDLAGLICDTFPEEAMRGGFTVQIEADTEDGDKSKAAEDNPIKARKDAVEAKDSSHELVGKVMARVEELCVNRLTLDAAVWGRVFGDACIFLGVDDRSNVSTPLRTDGAVKLKFLSVYDKRDLVVKDKYRDPLNPKFDEPENYTFTNRLGGGPQQVIHESRLVFFTGARTAKRRRTENSNWGYSVLQKPYDTMRDFEMGWSSAALLMNEASQAVYGVKGLLEILSSAKGKQMLETRMQTIDMGRSVARALVIDAEGETFERKPTSFAGVADLLDRFCSRLAAATRIPVTILMGQSPAGLGATGASDIRQFYDRIRGYQKDILEPGLERILQIIILEQNGGKEPGSWKIIWPSLYQETDGEKSAVRKTVADTDKVYFDMGVLSAEDIALNRFGEDGWKMDTQIDLELRKELADMEAEHALERKAMEPEKAKAELEAVKQPTVVAPPPGKVPAK